MATDAGTATDSTTSRTTAAILGALGVVLVAIGVGKLTNTFTVEPPPVFTLAIGVALLCWGLYEMRSSNE